MHNVVHLMSVPGEACVTERHTPPPPMHRARTKNASACSCSMTTRFSGLDPAAALSRRERRLLELVGAGLTNRQIAERMSLTERTTANYVSSLLGKLGMKRRAQAVGFAARNAK